VPLRANNFEELPSVNLTPMIDVVFLLIIFFMVGTQFTNDERQIDIKLPGANNLQAMINAPDRREVTIDSAGTAYLDGQAVTVEQLTVRLRELRAHYPDLAVAVRADGEAMQKYVVPVYGAIQAAGITNTAVLGLNNNVKMR
jgi:biopolymer transport protein ExbD